MTQKDVNLEQLRLIDDFLEEEIIHLSDSEALNAEIRLAITAVGEAMLADSRSVFENEQYDAWVALFDAP